jgi:hypothetical protein
MSGRYPSDRFARTGRDHETSRGRGAHGGHGGRQHERFGWSRNAKDRGCSCGKQCGGKCDGSRRGGGWGRRGSIDESSRFRSGFGCGNCGNCNQCKIGCKDQCESTRRVVVREFVEKARCCIPRHVPKKEFQFCARLGPCEPIERRQCDDGIGCDSECDEPRRSGTGDAIFNAVWNCVTNTATVTYRVSYSKTSGDPCRVTLNGPLTRIHEWERGCVRNPPVIRELSGIYNDENRNKRLDCYVIGEFLLDCNEFRDLKEGRYIILVNTDCFESELQGRLHCVRRR